jgi:hypothetical protein
MVNGKTTNKIIHGFKMSSLQTISGIKTSNGKTLLRYVLDISKEKYPNLLNVFQELKSIETSTKIKFDILEKEIKDFEKINSEIEKSIQDESTIEGDQFRKIMIQFSKKQQAGIRLLKSNLNEMFKEIDELGVIFAEENLKEKSFEFFLEISNFLKMIQESKNANDAWELKEMKKKEKELEKLKKASKPIRKSTRRKSVEINFDQNTEEENLEENLRSGLNLKKKIVKKRSMRNESLVL